MYRRILLIVSVLAIVFAAVALVLLAAESLRWRYVHDSPLMIYAGFMVAGGAVPYRNFFDMNMPGTYFVMWLMGTVFGWDDSGFRVFDLLCLAGISVATFVWIRRFGRMSAFAAAIVFPLWYLCQGPEISLQREYIALVPFTVMLAVATGDADFRPGMRTMLTGILAGLTFLVKPQFLVLSLPLLPLLFRQQGVASMSVRRRVVWFGAGVFLPVSGMFLYLLCTGSLGPFVDIAANYWPLYTHMDKQHVAISGFRRLLYLVTESRDGLMGFYAPMAVVGLVVLSNTPTERRYTWMMGGLIVAAAIYPAIAGQFWAYHWIPFFYVALCAAALAVRPVEKLRTGDIAPSVAMVFLLSALASNASEKLLWSWRGDKMDNRLKGGVPDEVSRFLRANIKTGDTVQPLDWTGGAVHGMLMARARLATRFMYDFHFYHNISSPYVGKLRREFLNELSMAKPRFIIQVVKNRPWPTGADTTQDFSELQVFLKENYAIAQQGATYNILERTSR